MRLSRFLAGSIVGLVLLIGAAGGTPARAKLDASGAANPPSQVAPPSNHPQPPHPLLGVSSVIRGDVTSVRYEYDPQYGPRTVSTLSNIKVIAGTTPAGNEISQLGGPIPNKGTVGVSELPRLDVGGTYMFFLTGGPWLYTPIWAGLAFRVVHAADRDVVVATSGRAVTQFSAAGVRFDASPAIEDWATGGPGKSAAGGSNAIATPAGPAISPDAFAASAVQALTDVGAPLGSAISLVPTWPGAWDEIPTSPQP